MERFAQCEVSGVSGRPTQSAQVIASETRPSSTELLGFPQVRNYDRSWTEYGSLVDVPIAVGAAA